MAGRILLLILCTVILAFRDQTLVRATTSSQDTFISVPSRQFVNLLGSGKTGHHIVQRDVARVRALFSSGEPLQSPSLPPDVPNDDNGLFGVIMDIQIGNGSYAVQADSGSSNSWIGANASNPYRPSGQSRDIGKIFNVTYGSGNVTGHLFSDFMGLPGVPSLFNQIFGVANASSGFEGIDGLLGIGPKNLTLSSVQPHELISTPTDNMLTEQIIHHNITAVFIPPVTKNLPGRLDFGGTSTEGLTTPINYVPNLEPKDSSLSRFYSVNQTIRYGEGENGTMILQGPAVMDTGTTLIGLTNASFQSYMQATNAVMDADTGLLRVDVPKQLKSLFFQFGENLYEFTPEAQIWPREHNTDIGGKPGATYLIVENLGDFSLNSNFPSIFSVNGMYWLTQYYVVFDGSDRRRVGIAETIYNFSNNKNKNKK